MEDVIACVLLILVCLCSLTLSVLTKEIILIFLLLCEFPICTKSVMTESNCNV